MTLEEARAAGLCAAALRHEVQQGVMISPCTLPKGHQVQVEDSPHYDRHGCHAEVLVRQSTLREVAHVAAEWPDGIHTCAELQRLEPGRRPCTCGRCPRFALSINLDIVVVTPHRRGETPMSTTSMPAQDGFYVSNVIPVPGKVTYVIVTDTERAGKLVMGYVVERPGQDREYLTSQGDDAPSPTFRDQLDEALDHYQAWAAKH